MSASAGRRLSHQMSEDCRDTNRDDYEPQRRGEAAIWFDLVDSQKQYGGNDADAEDVNEGQHSDVPSEGCRHPVHGHCLTSLRSVIVSKCQNLPALTVQTAVPSTSLFAARQTRRQTPRSYAADAVPRSKDATAGSSSNTSSWIVQGPKPKHRIVDERLGYVLLGGP
jgi:hypothetical protein